MYSHSWCNGSKLTSTELYHSDSSSGRGAFQLSASPDNMTTRNNGPRNVLMVHHTYFNPLPFHTIFGPAVFPFEFIALKSYISQVEGLVTLALR